MMTRSVVFRFTHAGASPFVSSLHHSPTSELLVYFYQSQDGGVKSMYIYKSDSIYFYVYNPKLNTQYYTGYVYNPKLNTQYYTGDEVLNLRSTFLPNYFS